MSILFKLNFYQLIIVITAKHLFNKNILFIFAVKQSFRTHV